MPKPLPTAVRDACFLGAYARQGAFTDCYALTVPGLVSLPELIEAFYTTPLFKVERWLLARLIRRPSTDGQARALAIGEGQHFAAWKVEQRAANEILLDAGQTRSWLSVEPATAPPGSTTLLFGSAVVPRRPGGRFGLAFHALLGFHRLYSRQLLAAAARRVLAKRPTRVAG